MKTSARESSTTRNILRTLNSLEGCRATKAHGSAFSKRGEPDIHGALSGHAFYLEVKRLGEKPTPLQALSLQRWEAAGARVGVVYSVSEALAVVNGEASFQKLNRQRWAPVPSRRS